MVRFDKPLFQLLSDGLYLKRLFLISQQWQCMVIHKWCIEQYQEHLGPYVDFFSKFCKAKSVEHYHFLISAVVSCNVHRVPIEPVPKFNKNTKCCNRDIYNFSHVISYYIFTTNCTNFDKIYNLVSELWNFKHHQFESQAFSKYWWRQGCFGHLWQPRCQHNWWWW